MTPNIEEARRCLLCKKPLCSLKGCPAHTPVPEAMALYREGKLEEAGRILFENNPLTAVTSLVCDWKQFCYGHCVLNAKGVPIRWYTVEQEISEKYLFETKLERAAEQPLAGRKIAVVGAGPAGIAAAVWLYRDGADIELYDANPRMGGVLRYGIPAFRLDKRFCDGYEHLLDVPGIRFHGSVALGRDLLLANLAAAHDAVLIATGAEVPAALRIPGEDLPGVVEALHYLKTPDAYDLRGKRVIVIGGGNVAMDACRTAIRRGADTWVYYRKTFENMPANPLEVEEARKDGVQFRVFQAPVEVRPGCVVFRDCQNETDPATGKLVTRILDGTDHEVPCDVLMPAISEKPDFRVLAGTAWKQNEWRWPLVDDAQRVQFEGAAADGAGAGTSAGVAAGAGTSAGVAAGAAAAGTAAGAAAAGIAAGSAAGAAAAGTAAGSGAGSAAGAAGAAAAGAGVAAGAAAAGTAAGAGAGAGSAAGAGASAVAGESAATAPSNVFIAGDFLLGPKTVVEAVASARTACSGIRTLLA